MRTIERVRMHSKLSLPLLLQQKAGRDAERFRQSFQRVEMDLSSVPLLEPDDRRAADAGLLGELVDRPSLFLAELRDANDEWCHARNYIGGSSCATVKL